MNDGSTYFQWICDCTPLPPPVLNACECPVPKDERIPAGCVQVENDLSGFDPVQIAKIKLKDGWFTSDIVFTTEQGCWEHDEQYSGKIWFRVIFDNNNLKVRNLRWWVGLRIYRDRYITFNDPPYNNILRQFDSEFDRGQWAASHTLNSDLNYRNESQADGIPSPRTRINYLLIRSDVPAAAPMLQGNPLNSGLSMMVSLYWPAAVLNLGTSWMQPDITLSYAGNARRLINVNYHELGHASHHSIVGEGYWIGYRNHIIAHFGYGEPPFSPSAFDVGKVALGEAVGDFTQNRYGNTFAGSERDQFEDNFIPSGLFFDLNDADIDRITDPNDTSIFINEDISGFTPAMLFDGLNGSISIRSYRNNLRDRHITNTPNSVNHFNDVLDVYDIFN